ATFRLPSEELRVTAAWKSDASPVVGCAVRVFTKTENLADAALLGMGRTDRDGVARLRFLEAGEVQVRVEPNDALASLVSAGLAGPPLRGGVGGGGAPA